jgi:hypothetical protein
MFSLQTLTGFPSTGAFSTSGYSAPPNTGTVQKTELMNLLDTRWSRDAMGRATSLSSSPSTSLGCLGSSGLGNLGADALGFGRSDYSFDTAGLGRVMQAGSGSLRSTIGDLSVSATMQSLAAGLAHSIASQASAIGSLIERSLTASPSDARKMLGAASQLVEIGARTTDKFSKGFQMASRGELSVGGDLDPGEFISGETDRLSGLAGLDTGNLTGDDLNLKQELEDYGVFTPIAPSLEMADISALFPITELPPGVGDIDGAIGDLSEETADAVSAKIGEAVGDQLDAEDDPDAAIGPDEGEDESDEDTADRLQGTGLLDGDGWKDATVIVSGNPQYAPLRGDPGLTTAGRSGSGSDAAVRLASLLGTSPPITGSFLSSDSSVAWGGSSTAVARGVSGALAEACSFNSAIFNAIGQILNGNIARSLIDALLAALECRRSTYSNAQYNAASSLASTAALLAAMKALLGVMQGGIYPALCAASALGLGGCA